MPRTTLRVLLTALVLALAAAASLRADVTRFDLAGTVTDGTGGVLPGVTVTLKNADTGFNRSTVTDGQGRYSFAALNPTGKWTLSSERSEERRVGKECRSRRTPDHEKKKRER